MVRLGDDVVDLRDLWTRYRELSDEQDEAIEEGAKGDTDALEDWEEDNGEEFKELAELFDYLGESPDGHGEFGGEPGLILDSYFEEYARQFAEDIGAIDEEARWPATHIDWPAAARDLQQDFTAVEVGQYTYWRR